MGIGSIRQKAALLGLGVALWGCGGGGGGGNSGGSPGILTYFTTFPNSASGESEVVKLKTSSGTVLQTQTVNLSTGRSPGELQFPNLPNATLYLQANLYSGSNGTGSAMGVAQTAFSGSTATTVTTDVGQSVSSVVVTPATTTITQGNAVALNATILDSNGSQFTPTNQTGLIFATNTPTWQVISGAGTVANVTGSGVVTGVAPGQATVQATYGGQSGTATVTVTGITKGTWTIMLFLNSANSLDLYSYGSPGQGIQGNVPQIEKIAQSVTSQTRLVMQWKLSSTQGSDIPNHPFNGTRRYVATHYTGPYDGQKVLNGLELVQDLGDDPVNEGADMGSAQTLTDFVSWAERNYPADHYALIMWDHGNGFERALLRKPPKVRAISEDDQTGNIIDVWQLGPALAGSNLDIISFDACLMQMLEVQDEVQSVAHYMVCSEDNTPGPGYPYDKSFGTFFTNPTADTVTLSKSIVDGDISTYTGYAGPVSQSVVDLTKIPSVVTSINAFAQSLIGAGSGVGSTVSSIRSHSIPYDSADGYWYYDLGSVANRFATSSLSSSVKTAAGNLLAAQQAATVYSRQNGLSADSTGLAIEFGNYQNVNAISSDYASLKLNSQAPSWTTFLESSALNPTP